MNVPPDISDIEYVRVNGEHVPFFKCPKCSFRNIHEETIRHHIHANKHYKYKNLDVDKIEQNELYVSNEVKKSPYHYETKEDYGLPWIKCLWCSYVDNVILDLEWHFLEEHKARLYSIEVRTDERVRDAEWKRDPFSWMSSDLEYRLFKASRLAKRSLVRG